MVPVASHVRSLLNVSPDFNWSSARVPANNGPIDLGVVQAERAAILVRLQAVDQPRWHGSPTAGLSGHLQAGSWICGVVELAEVLRTKPARVGIERSNRDRASTDEAHPRTPGRSPTGKMASRHASADDGDTLALKVTQDSEVDVCSVIELGLPLAAKRLHPGGHGAPVRVARNDQISALAIVVLTRFDA